MIERDGLIYFTEKPCRNRKTYRGDGCDEAFTPWELARHRNPWLPALSPDDEDNVRRRFRRDGNRSNAASLAREYGVTTRTIYRTLSRPVVALPCPGDRCQTMTPGGRLCHFCRRTAEGAA